MKLNYLLGFFLTILSIAPQYAQTSEREKILTEAAKIRFHDPQKSLKLYGFLAKDSSAGEIAVIQLKQLQLYRLLGRYEEAVSVFISLRKTPPNLFHPALQLEYGLEAANLFSDLDLQNEAQKFYRGARKNYAKLPVEMQKNYAPDLQLLAVKINKNRDNGRNIAELKEVFRQLKADDERLPFIQFNIAKCYLTSNRDSAAYYFSQVMSAQKSPPLSQTSGVYLNLLESDNTSALSVSETAAEQSFDRNLKPLLLNNAISVYEKNWNRDSLLYYHRKLRREMSDAQLKKRAAKVALIQDNNEQRQAAAAAETRSEQRQLVAAIGVLTLLLIAYSGYRFRGKKPEEKLSDLEQAKGIIISDKTEEEILEKLRKFEKSGLFLDPQLRLAGLAKKLDTNTRYLSSVINTSKAKSFNGYINSLRIGFILNKLNSDPRYRTYKISYLAQESGFISQSSFATAFKEVTGETPSTYIKKIKT